MKYDLNPNKVKYLLPLTFVEVAFKIQYFDLSTLTFYLQITDKHYVNYTNVKLFFSYGTSPMVRSIVQKPSFFT